MSTAALAAPVQTTTAVAVSARVRRAVAIVAIAAAAVAVALIAPSLALAGLLFGAPIALVVLAAELSGPTNDDFLLAALAGGRASLVR